MVEIKPKPKCCRNLFGSPSGKEREHMKKIYSECMKEDINIGKEKYEYDIVSDTPLSDRWELTTTAPEFYTRQYTSREERLNPLKRKMDVECEQIMWNRRTQLRAIVDHYDSNPLQVCIVFTPCLFIFVVYIDVVYISVWVRCIVYDGWCMSLMEPHSTAQHRNMSIIYTLMLPWSIVCENSAKTTLFVF